jgi:hypothetical protein
LGEFLEITEAQIVGPLISKEKVMSVLIFIKKLTGLHFGQYFQKLVWSPCQAFRSVA